MYLKVTARFPVTHHFPDGWGMARRMADGTPDGCGGAPTSPTTRWWFDSAELRRGQGSLVVAGEEWPGCG